MTHRTAFVLIILALIAGAAAYAIALQATGQQAEASSFVKWAGGGIGILVLFFFIAG